jgi:hypothetical protein
MKPKKIETLVWLLIYSGMLISALGLFLRASEPIAGLVLIVAGLVDAAAGVLLIWLRSRMTTDSKENDR